MLNKRGRQSRVHHAANQDHDGFGRFARRPASIESPAQDTLPLLTSTGQEAGHGVGGEAGAAWTAFGLLTSAGQEAGHGVGFYGEAGAARMVSGLFTSTGPEAGHGVGFDGEAGAAWMASGSTSSPRSSSTSSQFSDLLNETDLYFSRWKALVQHAERAAADRERAAAEKEEEHKKVVAAKEESHKKSEAELICKQEELKKREEVVEKKEEELKKVVAAKEESHKKSEAALISKQEELKKREEVVKKREEELKKLVAEQERFKDTLDQKEVNLRLEEDRLANMTRTSRCESCLYRAVVSTW